MVGVAVWSGKSIVNFTYYPLVLSVSVVVISVFLGMYTISIGWNSPIIASVLKCIASRFVC